MKQLICENCNKELGEVDKIDYDCMTVNASPFNDDNDMKLRLSHSCSHCKSRMIISVIASYLCVPDCSEFERDTSLRLTANVYRAKAEEVRVHVLDQNWNNYISEIAE